MRRVLRWMLALPVALAALLCAALWLWNLRDEPLDLGARRALARDHAGVPPADNLYYPLLALARRDVTDPVAAGLAILSQADQAHARRSAAGRMQDAPSPGEQQVVVGRRELACGMAPGCLERIATSRAELEQLVRDNRWLLDRYGALAAFQRVEYPRPLTPDAPLPPWSAFAMGKRLLLTSIALEFAGGHVDAAVARLRADALRARGWLAAPQLTLIDKMILAASYRETLEVAGELLRARPLSPPQYAAIADLAAPLGDAELSLATVFEREYEMTASVYRTLAAPENADQFYALDGGRSPVDALKGRIVRHFFQPNATLNHAWRRLQSPLRQAPAACRTLREEPGVAPAPAWYEWAYNPVGRMLEQLAVTAHAPYAGRLCDLLALQRLVRLQVLVRADGLTGANAADRVRGAGPDLSDPTTGRPFRWEDAPSRVRYDFASEQFHPLDPWLL